jgi:hypothetical protein
VFEEVRNGVTKTVACEIVEIDVSMLMSTVSSGLEMVSPSLQYFGISVGSRTECEIAYLSRLISCSISLVMREPIWLSSTMRWRNMSTPMSLSSA